MLVLVKTFDVLAGGADCTPRNDSISQSCGRNEIAVKISEFLTTRLSVNKSSNTNESDIDRNKVLYAELWGVQVMIRTLFLSSRAKNTAEYF